MTKPSEEELDSLLVTHTEYLQAREQEELHAAGAAMRTCGIDISDITIRNAARKADGGHSTITILACVANFFRQLEECSH